MRREIHMSVERERESYTLEKKSIGLFNSLTNTLYVNQTDKKLNKNNIKIGGRACIIKTGMFDTS